MPTDVYIKKTLTSFFYDLVKEVPAGMLNRILINSILKDEDGYVVEVNYSDKELERWAEEFARQLVDYELKFTNAQLAAMNAPRYVGGTGRVEQHK